jgi:hypothetical protein
VSGAVSRFLGASSGRNVLSRPSRHTMWSVQLCVAKGNKRFLAFFWPFRNPAVSCSEGQTSKRNDTTRILGVLGPVQRQRPPQLHDDDIFRRGHERLPAKKRRPLPPRKTFPSKGIVVHTKELDPVRVFGDIDDLPHRSRKRLERDLRGKAEKSVRSAHLASAGGLPARLSQVLEPRHGLELVFDPEFAAVEAVPSETHRSRELQLVLEERVPLSQTGGFPFAHWGDAYSFFAANRAKRSCCAPRSKYFRVFVASNAPTAVFQGGFFPPRYRRQLVPNRKIHRAIRTPRPRR